MDLAKSLFSWFIVLYIYRFMKAAGITVIVAG